MYDDVTVSPDTCATRADATVWSRRLSIRACLFGFAVLPPIYWYADSAIPQQFGLLAHLPQSKMAVVTGMLTADTTIR